MRLREMMAAHFWHIPPHEWDRTPLRSRAEMLAYMEVNSLIKSFYMKDPND